MAVDKRSRFLQFPLHIFSIVTILYTSLFLRLGVLASCEFPEALRMDETDPPWISHVRSGPATATSESGTVGVLPHDSEYFIRQSVMEIHYPGSPERAHIRWMCSMKFNDKVMLKRQDHLINSFYRCIKVYFRSSSLVQIAWSREVTTFDLSLCADTELELDPWLLVKSESLHKDYSQCPFSGGFNMRLTDSQLGDSACNLMRRPMRLEAECVGGEGISFDFVTSNCRPDLRMYVHQRTLCVANWKDQENRYIVLRRNEDIDLWCFVLPLAENFQSGSTAFLYSDLTCRSHPQTSHTSKLNSPSPSILNNPLKYFTLRLSIRQYSSLCEDEYPACRSMTCNAYVKHECQRSCQVCDPDRSFPSCEYPKRLRGSWQQRDINGVTQLHISGSNFSLDRVGDFRCMTYPDGPKKKSRAFTAVTLSNNGCRPRYSCLKIKRLGPAAISYSLSHSFIWPELQEQFGSRICAEDRFFPDPSPLDDLYRSHQGSGKPVVSLSSGLQLPICNISSVINFSATFQKGYTCTGKMYKHCGDPTKLRFELNCDNNKTTISDYRCMANFEGHYWEKIVLVQNIYTTDDARCFVFSQLYSNEAYSLLAGQCDKHAFEFARSGLRKPLMKLRFNEEDEKCKSVPPETVTLPSTVSSQKATSKAQRLVNSHATMDDESRHSLGNSGSFGLVDEAETSHHSYVEQETSVQKSINVRSSETAKAPTRGRSDASQLSSPSFSIFALLTIVVTMLWPQT